LAFVFDFYSAATRGLLLLLAGMWDGFLSSEDRAFGGICCVFIRFFFLEYFYVLFAVLGTP
jgi:hypothetical protein